MLGATLFLHFSERRSDPLMGVAAVLLAIKPHLAYLFWLALFCWAVRERRWKVLAAGAVTGALLTAIPLAFDHGLLQQYWHTFTSQPPAQYRSPTLAHCLRALIDPDNFRLQFLAMVPGLAWFVPWFYVHRNRWDWKEQLPLLLTVSAAGQPRTAGGRSIWCCCWCRWCRWRSRSSKAGHRGWQTLAIIVHIAIGVVSRVKRNSCARSNTSGLIWMCPTVLVLYVGYRMLVGQAAKRRLPPVL